MLIKMLQEKWSNPAYDEKIASLWQGATFEEQNEAIEFLLTSGPIVEDTYPISKQTDFKFDIYLSPLKYFLRQFNKGMLHLNEEQFLMVIKAVETSDLKVFALAHEKELNQVFCDYIIANFDASIRSIIAFRNDLSKLVIEYLACDFVSSVRQIVALRDDLPQHVRNMLAKDEDRFVRMNLEDPKDMRIIMNAEPSRLVVSRIPANTRLPHEKVLELSRDLDVYKRQRLAAWNKLPEDIIYILRNDKEEIVRSKLAEYHDLPFDVTEQLVHDKDESVRARIAAHGNINEDLIEVLAQDTSPFVRHNIAQRSHLPAKVMQRLVHDSEIDIRQTIALHKDVCWEWL